MLRPAARRLPAPRRPAVAAVAVAVLLAAGAGRAHEKWFVDAAQAPTSLASAFAPPNLWALLASGAAIVLAALAWRLAGGRSPLPSGARFGAREDRLAAFFGLVPAILGVHLAVPLLVYGVQGNLFAPSLELPGAWRFGFGLLQTGVALSLFYGGLARAAGALLALLWAVGLPVVGVEGMLENLHVLGFALFFVLAGRGPLAVDRVLFPAFEPRGAAVAAAPFALRIGVGLGLCVVAFTEKLANLPLARAFLAEYPVNFTAALGVPLPDDAFVLAAGGAELVIGALIALGIFPRLVIVLAWLPFNLTLTAFTWPELIGHLPIYGAMAVLLLWQPRPEERAWWLRGMREAILPLGAPGARG